MDDEDEHLGENRHAFEQEEREVHGGANLRGRGRLTGDTLGGGGGEIPESEADEYARQEIEFDRDLWVVEIEDFDERYELDGPIEA